MKNKLYFAFIIIIFISGCNKSGPEQFNLAPIADAGADIILLLPANETYLDGSAFDENNEIKSQAWTNLSGPNTVVIENKSLLNTRISNLVEGIYLFELKVTDKQDAYSTDIVEVRVMRDQDPVVIAGNDTTITLPYSHALLTATVVDNDYDTAMYGWVKIAGPGQPNIESTISRQTRIMDLIEGTYQFQLTVMDKIGNIAKDTMSITVQRDANLYTADTILQATSLLCAFGCTAVLVDNITSIVLPGQPFLVYMAINNGWLIIPPSSFTNNFPDLWMLYQSVYSIENGKLIIHSDGEFAAGSPIFKIVY